jgi:phosphate starvation-inducible protein PhoH
MSRKPADSGAPRARIEIEFDQPHLMGPLFGEFDRNLIAIEDKLGVYIAARAASSGSPSICTLAPRATSCRASTTGSTRATTSMPRRSRR